MWAIPSKLKCYEKNPLKDASGDVLPLDRATDEQRRDHSKWMALLATQARRYESYFLRQRDLVAALPSLAGKALLCWCREGTPEAEHCHARVLARYANAMAAGLIHVRDGPMDRYVSPPSDVGAPDLDL